MAVLKKQAKSVKKDLKPEIPAVKRSKRFFWMMVASAIAVITLPLLAILLFVLWPSVLVLSVSLLGITITIAFAWYVWYDTKYEWTKQSLDKCLWDLWVDRYLPEVLASLNLVGKDPNGQLSYVKLKPAKTNSYARIWPIAVPVSLTIEDIKQAMGAPGTQSDAISSAFNSIAERDDGFHRFISGKRVAATVVVQSGQDDMEEAEINPGLGQIMVMKRDPMWETRYPDFEPGESVIDHPHDLIPIAVDRFGKMRYLDLSDGHAIVGGLTGSGKSYFLHIIINALSQLDNVALFCFDFKGGSELGPWESRATEFITNGNAANKPLKELAEFFEARQKAMNEHPEYIRKLEYFTTESPFVLIVIDEAQKISQIDMTPLEDGRAVSEAKAKQLAEEREQLLIALSQTIRSLGGKLLLGTQRPDKDTIDTKMRNNYGTRVAFRCAEHAHAKMILGSALGKGASEGPHTIPQHPFFKGVGYINTDMTGLDMFKAIFLSGEFIEKSSSLSAKNYIGPAFMLDPQVFLESSAEAFSPAEGHGKESEAFEGPLRPEEGVQPPEGLEAPEEAEKAKEQGLVEKKGARGMSDEMVEKVNKEFQEIIRNLKS